MAGFGSSRVGMSCARTPLLSIHPKALFLATGRDLSARTGLIRPCPFDPVNPRPRRWDATRTIMSVSIGTLREVDLAEVIALSTGEGWNQTEADWRRLLSLAPDGCFAARVGGRLVGTVTTTMYDRALAWIGMMIVHPTSRRQGIGEAMMTRALAHLDAAGVSCVRLDATPAGL